MSEIMERVVAYEKKKLYLWYEVVVFVLLAILIAEVILMLDLVFEIQTQYFYNFGWVFYEDLETIRYLAGSIFEMLYVEFPWLKLFSSLFVFVSFLLCLNYVFHRIGFKRIKGRQIHKFEENRKK